MITFFVTNEEDQRQGVALAARHIERVTVEYGPRDYIIKMETVSGRTFEMKINAPSPDAAFSDHFAEVVRKLLSAIDSDEPFELDVDPLLGK